MTRVPRRVPGVAIRQLPLTPADAFVFSCIDGATSEPDLALITGLKGPDLAAALDRLRGLGAIDFGETAAPARDNEPAKPPGARPPAAPPVPPPPQECRSAPASARTRTPIAGTPRLYDPAELNEDVELPLDRRQLILDLFYRLDELSYYELLGVAITADKKEIKRAYLELAPSFHPDKFFRKRLGSYKAKIETIFARLTLAHDVLTHRTRRPEYDAYLEQVLKNRSMAAWMERTPPSPSPAAGMPAVSPVAPPPPPPPDPRGPPEAAAELDRIRRQTLARKLAGGLRRVGSGFMPATSASPPAATGAAPAPRPSTPNGASPSAAWPGSALSELDQLLRGADTAAQRGDFVGAAEAVRAALTIAPLNADVRRRAREAQERATGALADGYLKQAAYEATEERWAEASWSYAKGASLLPDDAAPHERVAFATLAMGGSPQRAIEFARRAVEIAPNDAVYRVTLARALLAAGQEASGCEELDRASALAPDDLRIKALAAELIEQSRRRGR